jgi:hypothetical protein
VKVWKFVNFFSVKMALAKILFKKKNENCDKRAETTVLVQAILRG